MLKRDSYSLNSKKVVKNRIVNLAVFRGTTGTGSAIFSVYLFIHSFVLGILSIGFHLAESY